MAVDPQLLELLRCPKSRAKLIYFPANAVEQDEFLFCPESRLRYRIDDGIPVMLIDEATPLDSETCAALRARAADLGLL